MKAALVAVAGAVGALTRYGVGVAFGVRTFPWATLGINLAGSFFLGLLLTTSSARNWSDVTTVPLAVGFLGAFTTFSTFSYETFALLRADQPGRAAVYVVASVVGGIGAAAAGYATGRAVN